MSLATVMPYPRGNIHPRFWGWVNGSGLPIGICAAGRGGDTGSGQRHGSEVT